MGRFLAPLQWSLHSQSMIILEIIWEQCFRELMVLTYKKFCLYGDQINGLTLKRNRLLCFTEKLVKHHEIGPISGQTEFHECGENCTTTIEP